MRFLLASGTIMAALAVILGASGAHALSDILQTEYYRAIYQTAANYQFGHAIALLISGILMSFTNRPKFIISAGIAFLLGIIAFSGSLYFIALVHPSSLGLYALITPLGGLLFIIGWLLLLTAIMTTDFRFNN